MKIWLVIEHDYDSSYIHGAYPSEALAEEHSRVMGFDVKEVEVSASLPPEAQDSAEKQQARANEQAEARRKYEKQLERDEAQGKRMQEFNPAEHIAHGGGISLCHCRTFSTYAHFVNPHGYCSYCGGTVPEVFRKLKGEQALQDAINKLAEHDRIKMREMTAI